MTVRELSQLYWLKREAAQDARRLAELEARAAPGAPVPDGMPRPGGPGDPTGALAVQLADLRAQLLAKQRRCLEEQQRLEAYIAGIPDSLTRQIFTLRFVEGKSWTGVAMKIGAGVTGDGCRMKVVRWLQEDGGASEKKRLC